MGENEVIFSKKEDRIYKALFETLFGNISEYVFIKDTESNFLKINTKATEALGLKKPEQAIGKSDFDFFPEKIAKETRKDELQIMKMGKTQFNKTLKMTFPDKSIHWIELTKIPYYDKKGKIVGIAGIGKDITDWMNLEKKLHKKNTDLKDKNDFLKNILEVSPNCVYVKDKKGRYLIANKTIADLYQTSPEKMIGKKDEDFANQAILKPAEADFFEDIDSKAIKTKEKQVIQCEPFTWNDGTNHYFHTTKVPISFKDKGDCVLGISVDITDLKNYQELLEKNEEKLKMRLNSILSPEHDIGNEEFKDIIDIDAIQSLMDEFYKVTNIGMAIVDMKGEVLVKTGWQDICTKFHRVNKKTRKNCIESDIYLSRDVKPGDYLEYKCKNNMWDIATPIMIGKKRVGTFFLGQFFYDDEDIDYDLFEKQAEKYGFDKKEYLDALDQVPRWSRKKVEKVMNFYSKFTFLVSLLSYSNFRQAKIIEERKKIEKELKETEDKLRSLVETTTEFVWQVDTNGVYNYVSENVSDIIGYKKSEVIGKTPFDFMDKSERKKISKIFSEIVEKKEKISDLIDTWVHKNGEKIIFETNATPLFNEKKDLIGYFGVCKNITQRVKAKNELKLTLDATTEGIWTWNFNNNELQFSDRYYTMIGYKPQEFKATYENWIKLIHPDDKNKAIKKAEEYLKDKPDFYENEFRLKTKNGKYRWIHAKAKVVEWDQTGEPVRMIGSHEDITEMKIAEKKIKYLKKFYNFVLDKIHDGIWVTDKNDRMVYFNPGMEKISGIKSEDALGMDVTKDFNPETTDVFIEYYKKAKKTKKSQEYEAEVLTPRGKFTIQKGWLTPRFKNGKYNGMSCTAQDKTREKKSEESLKESRERYQGIFEGSNDAIFLHDIKDGKILSVNNKACEMYGYNKNELIGLNISELTAENHNYSRDLFIKGLKKVRNSNKKVEWHAKDKKGRLFWAEVNPNILKIGKKERLLVNVRDITDRKKAEEALKESEEKYRELFNSALVGITVHNSEGKTIAVNHTAEKIFGYSEKELMKKDLDFWIGKLIRSNGEPMEISDFPVSIVSKSKVPSEGRIVGLNIPKKKNIRWFLHSARPTFDRRGNIEKIVTSFIDITDRRQTEERLQRIFELSTDIVCEVNIKTKKFTNANPAFKKILGYKDKELFNISFFDIIHPEDREKTMMLIEKKLKHGKKVISFVVRCKCKNETYRWLEWNARALPEEGFVYGIGRDITERKKQEQLLKKQMMKYDIEEGNTYLIKEKTHNKSIKAFNDLLDVGYKGLILSRALKKNFLKNIDHEFDCFWLSENKLKNSIKPNVKNILTKIKNQKEKTVLFFDRLDYLISKNSFNKTLDFIQKIREIAILKELIVIFSIDEETLAKNQIIQIEKETMDIEPITKQRLTKDLQKIIEFTHKQNVLGLYPKYKDLEIEMSVSKPTLRNKIRWLVKNNYIIEHKDGRSKNLEVTDKSRNLFL